MATDFRKYIASKPKDFNAHSDTVEDMEDILHLPVGANLQLQAVSTEATPRYQVKVIGYLPGGSLVVTTPTIKGKVQLVREGQRFNVRMLCGSDVMGFVAKVLKTVGSPYPYIHLEYPKEVESIVVRNAQRVAANLEGTAYNILNDDLEENQHQVMIPDLSSTGAKIISTEELGEVGDILRVTFVVQVAGEDESLTLLGKIRNRTEKAVGGGFEYAHGLQFQATNRFQHVLLHGWVLERMTADEKLK